MPVASAASESDELQAVMFGPRLEPANLDLRYGKIGIVAVAAAVRYAGTVDRQDQSVRLAQIDQRFIEMTP